ncbi:hypothetical protein SPONN_1928 [uncultured Candidatus Thioglobus sp.]|nr:hypothetical protein SPONN_1928 [uncultured Candidatus Thioglobus sp.]
MNNNLNQEEKELLESYENDEWVSIKKPEDFAKYSTIASNTFKTSITIHQDLNFVL